MLAVPGVSAHGEGVNKQGKKTDLKPNVSHAECERVETEQSRYFTLKEPQKRLGEDFFDQSCISLAKAMLGKVPALTCFPPIVSVSIITAGH